jgi:hypothetical protein
MSGLSHDERVRLESGFYAFLQESKINSKDHVGLICIGEHLFYGQRLLIGAIFDALEDDIHKVYVLKSRQLGISSIIRLLVVYLQGMVGGLKGAVVFDTSRNESKARTELVSVIENLPASLKFPKIKGNNRDGLMLQNQSTLLFMSAGSRKTASTKSLGASTDLTLCHLSEICNFGDPQGIEVLENAFSDVHPMRLYIYESTARGYGVWSDIWDEAVDDTAHCKTVFLGFWSKESQRIERDHPDFQLYGVFPPSEKEQAKIAEVKYLYDFDITPEQLAWVRRKMDPAAKSEGENDPKFDGNTTRLQEQPWTAEDAFQQTGSVFFSGENLTNITNKYVTKKFNRYMFRGTAEFAEVRVYQADNMKSAELKVFADPDPDGVYVIGGDPAHGADENNDRSALEVFRCYSDGMDQVAEYAWPLATTRQLAWALCGLLGWYAGGGGQVRYIMELNGPGQAVVDELKSVKYQVENGYQFKTLEEKGLRNIFRNVTAYIYSRVDAIGHGHNYHFKTGQQSKILIMERLRDSISSDKLHIRSIDLINEMRTMARDGDKIEGSKKDDRVIAAALANYYWETKIRRDLIARKMTRESEAARKRLSITDQVALFNQNHLDQFFAEKRTVRMNTARMQQKTRWRYG